MVKHTQTICRQQPTNCLSAFDDFLGLALKGLILKKHSILMSYLSSFSSWYLLYSIGWLYVIISLKKTKYTAGYRCTVFQPNLFEKRYEIRLGWKLSHYWKRHVGFSSKLKYQIIASGWAYHRHATLYEPLWMLRRFKLDRKSTGFSFILFCKL